MNDRRKSMMLAKAMGWEIKPVGYYYYLVPVPPVPETKVGVTDLYDPTNMALAWRCHLWALQNENGIVDEYLDWWHWEWVDDFVVCLREDAQRLWLDKIFELIENREVEQ